MDQKTRDEMTGIRNQLLAVADGTADVLTQTSVYAQFGITSREMAQGACLAYNKVLFCLK